LTAEVWHLPIEPILRSARFEATMGAVPNLPFLHVITKMNPQWIDPSGEGAQGILQQYLDMLGSVGLSGPGTKGDTMRPRPYNLLVTREWMFLVPRSTECFGDISVNALGFAGGFLVRDEEQFNLLKKNWSDERSSACGHVSQSSISQMLKRVT
jgi:ATP adenylyltransferase